MKRTALLPQSLLKKFPALDKSKKDPMILAEFYYPGFDWHWFVIEFDGDDTFFGLVAGDEVEFGYFSLRELLDNRGPTGRAIQRRKYFRAKRASKIFDLERRGQIKGGLINLT